MALDFGLGGFLSAFGKTKQTPQWYNSGVTKNLDTLAGAYGADNDVAMKALGAYGTANDARIANTKRLAGMAEQDYSNLFKSSQTYDPLASYERLRSGNLASLKDFSGALADQGRRQESLAMQSLGLGARPSGSYEKALVADRVSRNTAPVLNTIYGNLGQDTGVVGNQQTQNLSNLASLINARTATADYGAGLELNPANALMALRDAQIGQQGNIAGATRANLSGYSYTPNTLAKVGNAITAAGQGMSEGVGQLASIAGSVMGLGGAGGIASGLLGGGGGAKAQPQQNLSPAYQAMTYQPVNYAALSSPSAASYSPYGVYGMPQSPYSYLRY